MNEIRSGSLIKGPTAFAPLRLRYRCTTVALIVAFTVLVLSVSGVPQSWLTNSVVAVMVVAVVPVCALIIWVPVKTQAEQEAGYTTLRSELKELEQRDPYLGRIIRKPGGKYLEREYLLGILRLQKRRPKVFRAQPIPQGGKPRQAASHDGEKHPTWVVAHRKSVAQAGLARYRVGRSRSLSSPRKLRMGPPTQCLCSRLGSVLPGTRAKRHPFDLA